MDIEDEVSQMLDESIQQAEIICMECGKALRLLSHRHLTVHGLTPLDYKYKYGLPLSQSLCAHDLARRRETLAQSLRGNGQAGRA
jgi:predicted transcriptional regulator